MKRIATVLVCALGLFAVAPAGAADPDSILVTAQLVSPINSRINHQGDSVSAIVREPLAFRGDALEGVIEEAKSSGDLKKTSSLRFAFKTLTHQGRPIPVTADILRFQNSKGQPGVDEEGRVVKKSTNVRKALLAAAIGAGIGGAIGGAKGAGIGAGVGLAAGFIFVSVGVKGPEIAFDSNSLFHLAMKQCDRCAQAEAALNVRQYTNEAFSFFYPRQWQVFADPRSIRVSVAPANGVVRRPDGAVDIGFGAMAGMFAPNGAAAGDLDASTRQLVQALQADSPELRVLAPGQEVAAGEMRFYITSLGGNSPLQPGPDLNLLVTTLRPDGLFYLISIGPTSRYQEVQQLSLRLLQSLTFHN